jgi:hypothetical protein
MDEERQSAKSSGINWGVWGAAIVPVLLATILLVVFAFQTGLGGQTLSIWQKLGVLGALVAISLIAAAGVRFVMNPLVYGARPPVVPSADATELARSRIAPFILGLGGAAIIVLTLALVVSFALLATAGNVEEGAAETSLTPLTGKIDTILLGIFGSVLPIVATWVGTVIAFYFTSESYRQAAAVAMEATGGLRAGGPNVRSIMVPWDKILNKIEVDKRTEADTRKIKDMEEQFKAASRVMIFEKKAKNPVYIIRKKLVPADLVDDATVADYRASSPELAADSKRYGFLAETATTAEAKKVMQDNRFEDVFVTRSGQPTEEVIGWISDDMVKDM